MAEEPRKAIAVAAAANLKTAAEEFKKAFEAEEPGVEVSRAPFDLFLSAGREYPATVIAVRLGAAADEQIYACGKLVAWLPPGSTIDMDSTGLS